MGLNQNQVRWALFAALAAAAPCFYFVLFIVGSLPLPFILATAFSGTMVFLIHMAHAAFHAAVFYGLATLGARAIFKLKAPAARHAALAGALAALAGAASLPIYGAASNTMEWKNWPAIMSEAPDWLKRR